MSDGVNLYSPVTFSLVGLSLAGFVNDFTGGLAFADQAIELLKRIKGSRKVESRVLFLTHCFVICWLRPLQLSVKPLLTSYEVGMATGDTESAAWSIFIGLEYSFRSGAPLETLIADCAFYSEQLREVKQLRIMAVVRILWQAALHLSGDNPFDGTLTGDIVQQEKDLSEAGDYEAYLCTSMLRMLMYVQFVLGAHDLVHQSIMKTDMHKGGYEKGTTFQIASILCGIASRRPLFPNTQASPFSLPWNCWNLPLVRLQWPINDCSVPRNEGKEVLKDGHEVCGEDQVSCQGWRTYPTKHVPAHCDGFPWHSLSFHAYLSESERHSLRFAS
jgi:hypothetical protein